MMTKYRFGDLVREVKNNVDRHNNPYDYFIAGDHMDTDELHLLRRGTFKGSDVGPAFIRIFKPGQVLYGSRRTYLRKVAVADFEGITANTTFVLESKDESILLQRLLPFIMQSDRFVSHSIQRSKGSTNPYVLFSDLADYELELPSIESQRELAELLWSIDATRMAYKSLLKATDELIKSQFIEMFGDSETNPKKYPIKGLCEIAEYYNGLTYKPSDATDDENGTLVLRSGNIQNGALAFDDNVRVTCSIKEKLMVKDNDILMCSRNGSAALVGKTAIIKNLKEPMTFGAFMMIIRSTYYPYLKTYFDTTAFKSQLSIGTTTINQITGKMLNDVKLPVPDMDTVNAYGRFIEQSDKSKFELEQSIAELTATYKRIIMDNIG